MKRVSVLLLFAVIATLFLSQASELQCRVTVTTDRLGTPDADYFNRLQETISRYLNDNRFTDKTFSPNERISCNFSLEVTDFNNDRVTGRLSVQSQRPVYGSSYTTPLLNFRDDDISFDYSRGETIDFRPADNDSELAAILDFYAYLILGLDFNSFSPGGGNEYLAIAETVATGQSSMRRSGWDRFSTSDNRGSLISSITSPAVADNITSLIYTYHRLGLDRMSVSMPKAVQSVNEAVAMLPTIMHAAPMSVFLKLFGEAKLDELQGIYSKAAEPVRADAVRIIGEVYPTRQFNFDYD